MTLADPAEEVPQLALGCEADPEILASARALLPPRQRMHTTVKKSTVPIFVFDRLEQIKTMTRYQRGRTIVLNSLLEVYGHYRKSYGIAMHGLRKRGTAPLSRAQRAVLGLNAVVLIGRGRTLRLVLLDLDIFLDLFSV
ncbi:hypothetical protein T492DRAFT_854677 [Pavlovales sp. CCMP2436]|nr:hypothetical protein T492DRAFT_854677 [Pavlovales sp. CCMP2436]